MDFCSHSNRMDFAHKSFDSLPVDEVSVDELAFLSLCVSKMELSNRAEPEK